MTKRLLSLVLALAMVLSLFAGLTITASAAEVVDVLTNSNTYNGSATSYKDWTATSTNASYAGQSGGDSGTIQLRSSGNNSGIVATSSVGKVVKITVAWNSKTNAARSIDIYGKSSAYSTPSDLYGSNAGTKIGSIAYGSTELVISDEYAYIGIRSNNGALYLDSVTITWDDGQGGGSTDPDCEHENLEDGWGHDDENHWRVCSDCNAHVNEEPHGWGDPEIKDATCTDAGLKTYTCDTCKATKTEPIAATGHKDSDGDGKCDNCQEDMPAAPAKYAIAAVNNDQYYIMASAGTASRPTAKAVTLTSAGTVSTADAEGYSFTLDGDLDGTFSVMCDNGKYLSWSSSTNFAYSTSAVSWEVTDIGIHMVGGRYIRLYNTADFRPYTNAQSGTDATVLIPVGDGSAPVDPPVEDKVDWTVLDNALDAYKALNKDEYTPETWATLEAAVEAANKLYAEHKDDATQEQVNDAAKAITDAIAALKKVDTEDPDPDVPTGAFVLADSIAVGDKIVFVYGTGDSAKIAGPIAGSGSSTYLSAVDTVVTDNTVATEGALVFEVVAGSAEGTFMFVNEGNYLNPSTAEKSSNYVYLNGTQADWTVTFADGTATVHSGNRDLKYNTSAPRFSTYLSGQTDIAIYKQSGSTTPVDPPVEDKVDWTNLENAISAYENLLAHKDEYTADSWATLEAAYNDGYAMYGEDGVTQEEADKAAQDILDAIAALKKVETENPDPSQTAKYAIAAVKDGTYYIMPSAGTATQPTAKTVELTSAGTVSTADAEGYSFTLDGDISGTFSLLCDNGKYLSWSSSTSFAYSASAVDWEATETGVHMIGGRYIRLFTATNGTSSFRPYAGAQSGTETTVLIPVGDGTESEPEVGASLSLGSKDEDGDVIINIYLPVDMEFAALSWEYKGANDLLLKEELETTANGLRASFPIYMKDYDQLLTITLLDEDLNEENPIYTFEYSVKAYIDSTKEDSEAYALVQALSALCQLVKKQILGIGDDVTVAPVSADPANDAVVNVKEGYGVTYYGSSLIMHDTITIRHYFKFDDPTAVDDSFILEDGELIQYGEGSNYFYTDVTGIAATELATKYEVKLYGGDDVEEIITINYSVLSYANKVLARNADDTLNSIANALYAYYNEAVAYFN